MRDRLLYSPLAAHVLRPLVRLGVWQFGRTGNTPSVSYSAFRKLHCITQGELNRELTRGLAATPKLDVADADGMLGVPSARTAALAGLRRDGYHVFPQRLDGALCAELVALATSASARLIPGPPTGPATARFDGARPLAPRYELAEHQLLHSRAVRTLVADASVLALAQDYLGVTPVNDLVTMWWSAPYGAASSAAAQLFHFDMDRIGFLKLFVYLTDVTTDTGPHVYVAGSHRAKPAAFYRDRRFTDDEVTTAFPPDAIRELTGPAGTIIAADTSGLHKGKALITGHRLMFQLELTSSLFGQAYERHPWPSGDDDDPLTQAIRRYPYAMQRFMEPR